MAAKTLTEVLSTFPAEVQKRYDFTHAVYVNAATPIANVQCLLHGVFSQYSGNLRKGIACPACGAAKRAEKNKLPPKEFITRCAEVHKNKYDYSATRYTRAIDPINVICPEHGRFRISPIKHLHSAQGCPACGALARGHRKNVAQSSVLAAKTKVASAAAVFVARAVEVHGNTYDYSESLYEGMKKPVGIKCAIHGVFYQTPGKHIYESQGCPRCMTKSRGEAEVFAFLSNLTPAEARNRTILKPKELDIYLPSAKLAIEYCGEFWHSHGDAASEKKDRRKHIQKYLDCKAQGVRLITLWESEWKEHNYAVRRLLRNAVGKSKGKLMARKCELKKVTNAEARAFYDRYHPQGGAGSGEHYALFWKGKMVACMRFVLGANDRGAGAANRVWTLGRYATRITVAGAASRLFKAFVAEFNPPEVKSFSDNRFFDGGMYAQLGFVMEEEVGEDYQVWSPKFGLRPKSHYQRRRLAKRLEEHEVQEAFDPATDPRTEAEMTYLMGCRRIYDCGKKRWIWTASQGGDIIQAPGLHI